MFSNLFFPHDSKPEHFRALDGLRGLAVLFVLLSHSGNAGFFFHRFLDFSGSGKIGVYLFFVLSAYLLDRQIAIALMSNKSSKKYWLNYLLRRFLRIYPLFFIALLVHGLMTLTGYPTVIRTFMDLFLHMTMFIGKSIFWSIPVEFKYYFISPLIMVLCQRWFNWELKPVMISLLVLSFIAVFAQYHWPMSIVSTFRHFPIFLIGTLISIYELLNQKSLVERTKPSHFDRAGIVGLILIILSVPYYFKGISNSPVNFQDSIYYFPYAFLWGIILIAAKYGKGIIKWVLELKLFRFIGTISFSMYLFHMPVLILMLKLDLNIPDFLKVYVFFLLSIMISTMTYLAIERPLSKIRIYKVPLTEKSISSVSNEPDSNSH